MLLLWIQPLAQTSTQVIKINLGNMNSLFPILMVNNSGCRYLFIWINSDWLTIDWLIHWLIDILCVSQEGFSLVESNQQTIWLLQVSNIWKAKTLQTNLKYIFKQFLLYKKLFGGINYHQLQKEHVLDSFVLLFITH